MLCFSSFQCNKSGASESGTGPSHSNPHSTQLVNSVLVSAASETVLSSTSTTPVACRSINFALQGGRTPVGETSKINGMLCIREALKKRQLSDNTISLIMKSWRDSTSSQYNTYLNKWIKFCNHTVIDFSKPTVNTILEYLNMLYGEGLGYSALNTARSAMSAFSDVMINQSFGNHPLIVRLMKGVSRTRPSLPRYNSIWDVSQVFDYFRKQPLVQYLSLHELTLRNVMLVALVTAQRCQSLYMLSLNNMIITDKQYCFTISADYKQARKGTDNMKIILPAYPADLRICVFTTLTEYIKRTSELRKDDKLFISTIRPYGSVSKDTIAHWIKTSLGRAGIDTSMFKPHSTRSASVSKAKMNGADLQTILNTAGWSNAGTFAKFYDKPVNIQHVDELYANVLLQ